MPNRCPATATLTVDDAPLTLQCVHWSDDPAGRHVGGHLVHTPPALGDDHTWPNEDPLTEEEADALARAAAPGRRRI